MTLRTGTIPDFKRGTYVLVALIVALVSAPCPASAQAAENPAPHRNLFAAWLGKSGPETDAKLRAAFQQLFHGDDENERVYHPAGDDMAYIFDVGSGDVRSEGMSYGMMIAVQMDRQEEFDRLWKWAKTHMRHDSGPRRGWFSWHCARDGKRLSQNPASDGEEWIAMALFFAAHRWDAPSYLGEAQAILDAMLADRPGGEHELVPMFNREHAQIVFVPVGKAAAFTDPSYHLPAFYELWARWDDDAAERAFWMRATDTSRAFFRRAAHPATGLMPEYANFDGTPFTGFGEHRGDFRFDAWRTLANVALDHAWSGRDPWQVEQSNRVLRFLTSQGEAFPDQYSLDGKPLSTDTSAGLVAMAAVAALAADREVAEPFVQRLWDAPVPDGHWRYYNGLLHMIGLLQVSGRFQIHEPR